MANLIGAWAQSQHSKSAYAQTRQLCADCDKDCNRHDMYRSQLHGEMICAQCKRVNTKSNEMEHA